MADTSELTVPELKPPLQNTSAPRDKEPEGDLEKLRKWQEDRVTRKLRGEYESAVLHLSEVVCRAQFASHTVLKVVYAGQQQH